MDILFRPKKDTGNASMNPVPMVSQYDPYGQQTQQVQQPQQQTPQHMNPEPDLLRNLMVNYIPTTVDEVQLRQLFERYGAIESVKIVSDRETHQSRGYGFVKFQSASSAQQAIAALNGFNILNKRLKVALAASGHQRVGGAPVGDNGGYFSGYGGYGAYPPTANPYAQQQMMAVYQQYMMQQPTHANQPKQVPMSPPSPQQQHLQQAPQQQQQQPSQQQQQQQASRPVR